MADQYSQQIDPIWYVAGATAIFVVAGIIYYELVYAPKAAGQSSYHGDLTINGSATSIDVSTTGTLSWIVTGVTPGAAIQLGFDTVISPISGRAVVDTITADASGSASGTYTLTPGTQDMLGDTFYATAYDTAVGTVAGYSNPVTVNITG